MKISSSQRNNYDKKFFRMISILNKLNPDKTGRPGRISTSKLAEEFNVNIRTIQRDLNTLNMAGFPITELDKGVYSFIEGFSLGQAQLDAKEASLLSFMHEIAFSLGKDFEKSFNNILSKILSSSNDSVYYAKIPDGTKLSPSICDLPSLETAIKTNTKISIQYESSPEEEKEFILSPLKIVYFDGFWYLLSHTEFSDHIFKFRLEKIKKIALLDDTFTPPKNLKTILDESVNIWFSYPRDKKVVLKINKEIADYFRKKTFLPLQKITKDHKDGSITVQCLVSNYMEINQTILRFIPYINVLEPAELRDTLHKTLKNYLEI